jgi:hypothetical protein
MNENLTPIFWVGLALPVLLLMQRWIQTHLHGLSLLLTGKPERAIYLYAIILFPGVLLHEASHWLTATLLGVRTGSMSLLPRRTPDGNLQLGYVEYYRSKTLDPIRESLVGGAPLIVGTIVILLIGFNVFSLVDFAQTIQSGDMDMVTYALANLFDTEYILLWIYLIFAISNAMMPSKSDRRAWPAFIVAMIILAGFVFLLGIQNEVAYGLAQPVLLIFGYLGIAFSVAIGVDLVFMLILFTLEAIIGRIKGVTVVYGQSAN